jgi:hypothetical protein
MTLDHLYDRDSSADDSVGSDAEPAARYRSCLAGEPHQRHLLTLRPLPAMRVGWRPSELRLGHPAAFVYEAMLDLSRAGFLVAVEKPMNLRRDSGGSTSSLGLHDRQRSAGDLALHTALSGCSGPTTVSR